MASERNLIVHAVFQENHVQIETISQRTRRRIFDRTLACDVNDDAQIYKFFETLQTSLVLDHVKAILFGCPDSKFYTFRAAYNFRLKCQKFCEEYGIFYASTSLDFIKPFAALSQNKILVKEGEEVLVLDTLHDGTIDGTWWKRKKGFFQYNSKVLQPPKPGMALTREWKNGFLAHSVPNKMVIIRTFLDSAEYIKNMKDLFKEEKPIIVEANDRFYSEAVIDYTAHVMGEVINPFHVGYNVWTDFHVKLGNELLIEINREEVVPIEKCVSVKVFHPSKNIMLSTVSSPEPLQSIEVAITNDNEKKIKKVEGNLRDIKKLKDKLDNGGNLQPNQFEKIQREAALLADLEKLKVSSVKFKKVKVTLNLDINFMYDFKVEPIDVDDEEEVADLIEKISEVKIGNPTAAAADIKHPIYKARLLFGKQWFYVYLQEDDKKEKIIKDVDGCDKTPIYIAFTQKKPFVGKAAIKEYIKKKESVVLDLIMLCSISSANVLNPNWGFKLEKEENGTMMITVQAVDCYEHSSVDFFLALILKHGLKVVKNECGKKMEEIEIGFDGFSPNEILKNNFEKAANLINLKVVFV